MNDVKRDNIQIGFWNPQKIRIDAAITENIRIRHDKQINQKRTGLYSLPGSKINFVQQSKITINQLSSFEGLEKPPNISSRKSASSVDAGRYMYVNSLRS